MPWTDEWKQRQRPKNRAFEGFWLAFVEALVEAAGLEENQSGALDASLDFGKAGRIEVWAGGPYIDFVLNEAEATIEVYTQNGPHPAQYKGRLPVKSEQCNLEEFGLAEWVAAREAGRIVVNHLNTATDK